MNKSQISGAFCAVAPGIPVPSANAALIDPTVSDDRSIGDSNNDGAGDFPGAANDSFLRVFGNTNYWRAAIEFDLSSISSGDIITQAMLSLRDEGTSHDGRIDVYGYAGDGMISLADGSSNSNLVADFIKRLNY